MGKNPFDMVGSFMAGAAKAAVDTAGGAVNAAAKAANDAGKVAGGVANAAGKAAGDAVNAAGKAAHDAGKVAGHVANAAGKAIGDAANAVTKTASNVAEDAFTSFGGSTGKTYASSIKDDGGAYLAPSPVVDEEEIAELDMLTAQFESLIKPNPVAMLAQKAGDAVIQGTSKAIAIIGKDDLYNESMGIISDAFSKVGDSASKISVSEEYVVSEINRALEGVQISTVEEVCFLRSYDLSSIACEQRKQHLALALAEGAATGAPGLPGIPFNLVLSTFLFYRAVQSVAMFYGYDVKNDPAELELAGEVFMEAMSVGQSHDAGDKPDGAVSAQITKLMMLGEIATVKQTINKGWAEMAKRGGACLVVAQIRAMGNAGVKKTLENTGKKGLEVGVFKSVFEKIGKQLSKDVVSRAVPVVGGVLGAAFDAAQMNTILKYADLFYHKRFIVEKEMRIDALLAGRNIDDYLEIDNGFEVPAGQAND